MPRLYCLHLLAISVLIGCRDGSAPQPLAPLTATKVEIVKPVRGTVRKTVEQPGQVEAIESSPIHARTVGLVKSVSVDMGDRVVAGQILAELALPEVFATLEQAKASLGEAESGRVQAEAAVEVERARGVGAEAKLTSSQAGVRRAEADLVRRKRELERIQSLARESAVTNALVDESQSVFRASEAARDEALAQVLVAQAVVVEARASAQKSLADSAHASAHIELAKADLEQAKAMLSYSSVKSPFDGVITRRSVDTGQLVGGNASSLPLFTVAKAGVLTVSVTIPEVATPQIKVGATALIKVQALAGNPIEAKVSRTAFSLDPSSRGLRIEIDLPNADTRLRPGMYTLVTVVLDEHADVLSIPTSAIIKDGERSFCVKVEELKAHRVSVKIGLVDGLVAEVLEGLSDSDTIVKTTPGVLVDGQAVALPSELSAQAR